MTEEKKPERKPNGFGAFDTMARKLAQVPKTELEKKLAEKKTKPEK